ncbi:ABC transporter permease [Thalassoporum mexicanum]|uniref:ABC transporter permease n=1 Tax=Thalassoporum mexicanum TaxID=3457544 RepID=UPI00059FFFBB
MESTAIGWWGVPLAIVAGILRGSAPFLLVSLGECLTEKSGKINLGLEGTLIMGAMSAYGVSYLSSEAIANWQMAWLMPVAPWLGVIVAAIAGAMLGLIHGLLVIQPRINDVAVGIAMIIFGSGLAFFLGKPFIQPAAPQLPTLQLGSWSDLPVVQAALQISPLFLAGILLAVGMQWWFGSTRSGLIVRAVGDRPDAARAMGISVKTVRLVCIVVGSSLAGIGGACLSLYYPGLWTEQISNGQGLMAVALVIFARWQPLNCLYAALLFGGAQAIGPALQAVGIKSLYYLFNATPYILTLLIMIFTSSANRTLNGAPGALGIIDPPAS